MGDNQTGYPPTREGVAHSRKPLTLVSSLATQCEQPAVLCDSEAVTRFLVGCLWLTGCQLIVQPDRIEASIPAEDAGTNGPSNEWKPCANAPQSPTGTPFTDDFSDGVAGPNFRSSAPGSSTVVEQDGALIVTPATNDPSNYPLYESLNAFDLTNKAVSTQVEAIAAPTGTGAGTQLLWLDGANQIVLQAHTGKLRLHETSSASPAITLEWNPTAMRWWRLRHSGDQVAAEFSATGKDPWTALGAVSPSFPLTQMKIQLMVATFPPGVSSPTFAKFSQLNRCPP